MLMAIFMGAPMVPSKPEVTKQMVELLNLNKGQTLYDLGSGDGRVLVAAAKRGLKSVGIEINPYAWILSFALVVLARQLSRVTLYLGNYWKKDLRAADGVVVYGLPQITGRLGEKFKQELKPGTKVVSNSFQIPSLKLLKEEVISGTRIYLYQV